MNYKFFPETPKNRGKYCWTINEQNRAEEVIFYYCAASPSDPVTILRNGIRTLWKNYLFESESEVYRYLAENAEYEAARYRTLRGIALAKEGASDECFIR